MSKNRITNYQVGDEVAYAMASGMHYGEVTRVFGEGDQASLEITFEDGRKEIKKARDHALSLVRRASGRSEEEERNRDRERLRDPDVMKVFRSEQRKRW